MGEPNRFPGAGDAQSANSTSQAEQVRLAEDAGRVKNWKRWGPYLPARQWGTVREDYSATGRCWEYFTHEQAASRAFRWGEDGLLGLCDREGRLCFALALWNGRDPVLKERPFGLSNHQGNHGEDVKDYYYYLDATPTHSYLKALYKYPQAAFPYEWLVSENARRGRDEPEFELADTGIFNDNEYFDVFIEYAKADDQDILIRVTACNRGPRPAPLTLLPTLWFRNTWVWGCRHEGCTRKPLIARAGAGAVTQHETLEQFRLEAAPPEVTGLDGVGAPPDIITPGPAPEWLFTDNHTNNERLFDAPNLTRYVKNAFDDYLIHGNKDAVNPAGKGTKAAPCYRLTIPAGGVATLRLRLFAQRQAPAQIFGPDFDQTFDQRQREADEFYAALIPRGIINGDERAVLRQAHAGLLWNKQFYHYIVQDWLAGDPEMPPPPPERLAGRNDAWTDLYARDVLSVPDNWEYPWFAAWDLAFHMIPFARLDPDFAKGQLELLLREWYLNPNGALPAYEFNFSDTNPPMHAWACWRVYKITGPRGQRDVAFLERTFHKLLFNFTWWVNRKDPLGNNIFTGGFLGLDNIGVFDRSMPLPGGGTLAQADGTAWMAFYCGTMLSIALELARHNPVYEDIASKFFEHFVSIADAINNLGGTGLWNEADGFYYDQLQSDGQTTPLCLRSMVGIIPLFAVEVLRQEDIDRLPGFRKRLQWFMDNRRDLARTIAWMEGRSGDHDAAGHPMPARRLLAITSRPRLERVLRTVLDETEFFSPHGVRSLSAVYRDRPFIFRDPCTGQDHIVPYEPAESRSGLFGGNSNWRGPVWFPVNYLLLEALERYHYFYGDELKVECPAGSGRWMNLHEVACELGRRLVGLFLPDAQGRRPIYGADPRYAADPHWKDLVQFFEYFDGDTGRGLGASHQAGWTALVARLIIDRACEGE